MRSSLCFFICSRLHLLSGVYNLPCTYTPIVLDRVSESLAEGPGVSGAESGTSISGRLSQKSYSHGGDSLPRDFSLRDFPRVVDPSVHDVLSARLSLTASRARRAPGSTARLR